MDIAKMLSEAKEQGYKEGKAKARFDILDNIHEIYKCQLYCKEEYCDKEEPTASNCVDCFYDAIMTTIERG